MGDPEAEVALGSPELTLHPSADFQSQLGKDREGGM